MKPGPGRTLGWRILPIATAGLVLFVLARWLLGWRTLEGRILDPAGAPVAEALVAVLPVPLPADALPWERVRLAHSDRQGRFRLKLRPGPYALSASHAQLESLAGVRFFLDSERRANGPLTLRMAPARSWLEGRLEGGAPWGLVALAAFAGDRAPRDGPVHFVEVADGGYRLGLAAGNYAIATRVPGFGDFEGCVQVAGPTTRFDPPLAAPPSKAPRAVQDWIRAQGRELASLDADGDDLDLLGLGSRVGLARIVALGEPCHGTREFTRLHYRLIAYLVRRLDFNLIALEVSPAATAALNGYVLDGAGDPGKALAELGFWFGPSPEFQDLVRWVRAHNLQPGLPKVSFQGIDIRSSRIPYAELEAFLAADPAALALLRGPLAGLRTVATGAPAPERAQVEAWLEALERLRPRLDAVPAGPGARALQRRNLILLTRFAEILGGGLEGALARERAMAEQVDWVMERAGAGAKAVLWAHNGHVAKGAGRERSGLPTLGRLLERRWGRDLVVVGGAFRMGSFLSQSREHAARPVATFSLPANPEGTLDAALASAGKPILLLDLRELPEAGPVAEWFRTPQGSYAIGAEFSPVETDAHLERVNAAECYDLLVFLERVNPPG